MPTQMRKERELPKVRVARRCEVKALVGRAFSAVAMFLIIPGYSFDIAELSLVTNSG
jgi:hypothetical protein